MWRRGDCPVTLKMTKDDWVYDVAIYHTPPCFLSLRALSGVACLCRVGDGGIQTIQLLRPRCNGRYDRQVLRKVCLSHCGSLSSKQFPAVHVFMHCIHRRKQAPALHFFLLAQCKVTTKFLAIRPLLTIEADGMLCSEVLVDALSRTLFGNRIYEAAPDLVQSLFDFNYDAWMLIFHVP